MQRLRTILRLQRDEFLPLRVIRQELAAGRADEDRAGEPAEPRRRGRASALTAASGGAGTTRSRSARGDRRRRAPGRELEEYGVIKGERRGGEPRYDDIDREIIRAVGELTRYGVGGAQPARLPHLGRPRGGAARADPRARAPLAQSGAPKEAVEALENLAAVGPHLKHLLLVRDLRRIAP